MKLIELKQQSIFIMQNPFRIKNNRSLKQMLSDENFQQTDFHLNFISPWNNAERISQENDCISYNPYSCTNEKPTFIPITQNYKLTKPKNIRAKTQESKYSTTSVQFRKKGTKFDENFSNLFATDYFIKRNCTTPLKFKKHRQLKSREKFTTPVINLNEFSFSKDKKLQMKTLVPKLQDKFNSNFNFSKSFVFSKQNCNLSLTKPQMKQLRKFSTQKIIPMKQMSDIQRSRKLKKQLQNLYEGHGALVENLKRVSYLQKHKGFRQLKYQGVNKLNKTIF